MRCRHCRARFWGRTWDFSDWIRARCPKCLSPELELWSLDTRKPSLGQTVFLVMGANAYRCQKCRTRFVSFRLLRQKEHHRQAAVRGGKENGSK